MSRDSFKSDFHGDRLTRSQYDDRLTGCVDERDVLVGPVWVLHRLVRSPLCSWSSLFTEIMNCALVPLQIPLARTELASLPVR